MKKIIAIALALMLCVGMLSVSAFAAFETADDLAIIGKGIPGVAEWKADDAAGDMTETTEGIWEKTLDLTAGTTMNFKVSANNKWDDTCNLGSATIVLGEKADLENGPASKDMAFTADKDMTIKITVDLTGEVATILVVDVNAAGDDTTTGGDDTTVEIDPNAKYYVTGSKADNTSFDGSWLGDWNVKNEAGLMTHVGNGIYEISFENVPAGEFEFKINDGTWDKNWGKDGANTDNVKITVAGGDKVTIRFDSVNGKISVSGATSNVPATGDMGMTAVFVVLAVACCGVVALVCTKKKFF